MFQLHYSLTNKPSTVTNESITASTTILIAMSSTVTTKSSTVMEIDIVIQQVMDFVGMGNWEQVHTFAAVCKIWRHLLYLISPILGKFQWMVERNVD
jgi:hypothetical protein